MSKEIIERIKQTEENAAAAVRSAQERARDIREEAKSKADAIVREARESGEAEMAKVTSEGEEHKNTALEDARRTGTYESAESKAFARVNFDKAVQFVLGRLTE